MVGIGQMLQLFIIEMNYKTWPQFLMDILNQMIRLRSYSLLSHMHYFQSMLFPTHPPMFNPFTSIIWGLYRQNLLRLLHLKKKKKNSSRWQGGLLIVLTRMPLQALLFLVTQLTLILRIQNAIRICTLSLCVEWCDFFCLVLLRLRM